MKLLNIGHRIRNNFGYTDTEHIYRENLKTKPRDWLWRTKKVTYTLNRQGYRALEWSSVDWNNSILMFGCSFVFGLGVDDKDTAAHKIYESTFVRTINLGMPGGAPMATWVNSTILRKENIQPKAIIYLWPFCERVTVLRPNKQIYNNSDYFEADSLGVTQEHHYIHGLEFLRYCVYNTTKLWSCPVLHYHLERDVCKFIPEMKLIEDQYKTKKLFPDEARDFYLKHNRPFYHPGPLTHTKWANLILKDLQNNNVY